MSNDDFMVKRFKNDNVSSIKKLKVDYEPKCNQFIVTQKDFQSQYFLFYNARLEQMYDYVKINVKHKWGENVKISKLNSLNDIEPDTQICLIGVLFKYMEKHPSILKEVSDEYQLLLEDNKNKFISDGDYLMLQEERDTIRLEGNIDANDFVNGVVLAVLGKNEEDTNKFIVEEYCYAGPIACLERPIINEDKYVVLVSGLGFSKNMSNKLKNSLECLQEFLIAFTDKEVCKLASKVVKVIIAGNFISKNVRKEEYESMQKDTNQWIKKNKSYIPEIMEQVDRWVASLGKFIDVDIMPGELDPTSILLPQQPFHVALFSESSTLSSIRCLTNPYAAKLDGTLFVGNSGQTVNTIREYSKFEEPLDILERQLVWNHLAPTAPDSLHCYSFINNDPFIIKECPHVFFAGNQEYFNTKIFDNKNQKVTIISVPCFEESFTCVLVNLKNLECDIMSFD